MFFYSLRKNQVTVGNGENDCNAKFKNWSSQKKQIAQGCHWLLANFQKIFILDLKVLV